MGWGCQRQRESYYPNVADKLHSPGVGGKSGVLSSFRNTSDLGLAAGHRFCVGRGLRFHFSEQRYMMFPPTLGRELESQYLMCEKRSSLVNNLCESLGRL